MRRREQYSMFATLAGSKLSLGTDHLTCRCGGLWFVVSFRVRIFIVARMVCCFVQI